MNRSEELAKLLEIEPYCIWVEKIENDFVVVSCGYENPFRYVNELNEVLSEYSCNDKATIYVDLLAYRGNRNRFIKTTYKNNKIDIIYSQNIEESTLPSHIRGGLANIYSQKSEYILGKSNLSEYEKELVAV